MISNSICEPVEGALLAPAVIQQERRRGALTPRPIWRVAAVGKAVAKFSRPEAVPGPLPGALPAWGFRLRPHSPISRVLGR